MSEPTEQVEALSTECEAYLASQDLYSTAEPRIDRVLAKIYTIDGDFITEVSSSICLFDLQSLLQLRAREFARGMEAGKVANQFEIRAVLGFSS